MQVEGKFCHDFVLFNNSEPHDSKYFNPTSAVAAEIVLYIVKKSVLTEKLFFKLFSPLVFDHKSPGWF